MRKNRVTPPPVAPKIIEYPGGIAEAQITRSRDTGELKVAFVFHEPGTTHVFPMPPEYSERVAGRMTALAIEVQAPTPGEHDAQDQAVAGPQAV